MMKKTRLFMFVAALGLLSALLVVPVKGWARPISAGASAATAGPHLSGEIVISALDNEEYLPAVAYNWKHREYLVVWHTKWAIGTRDIRAARVSEQGELISWFTVATGAGSDNHIRAQPSVAYDPINDRYLVVFIHDIWGDGSDWDVDGRFIPWDGPSAYLTEFPISNWNTHQWNPKVAYGRAVEEFLVVWANEYQAGTPPMYISGRRVKADGSGFPGGTSDLTISNPTENRVNPDVTYNLARNEYMVVYDNAVDIFGIRLTGDLGHNFGGEFVIAGWPSVEIRPAVAACQGADQYLVAWQSDQSASNDAIYARFIGGDGTLAGVHLIADSTGPEREPDVACNQAGNQYLVAWQTIYVSDKYGIMGRLVHPDETMDAGFVIVDASWTAGRTEPVVAGGYTNYLVAWEHERDGTSYQDIHGRLITPYTLFLPLVVRNYP
jgi:hypothetical protein